MFSPISASDATIRVGGIPGYFDYAWLYERIVERCCQFSAPFVEVGVFMGKSLSYAALRSSGQFPIYGVDAFDGRAMGDGLAANNLAPDDDMYSLCRNYMGCVGALAFVELIRGDSTLCAERFADASVGAVFIDADHSEEAVRADIRAWLPKVMTGGILAGHDIFMEGVLRAFDSEIIGNPRIIAGSAHGENTCWYAEAG